MKGSNLGELEELILLSVASLGNQAYAVSLRSYLLDQVNRKVNISAVHSSLYRLEKKGYLSSFFGGATQKRGGKQKRYFQVTNAGMAALQEAKTQRELLWKTIPQLNFSTEPL